MFIFKIIDYPDGLNVRLKVRVQVSSLRIIFKPKFFCYDI
jgi:hypothetical protein